MEIDKIIGHRIKKCRQKKQMSQKDLAYVLEVSQTTITAWENNKQEPSLEKIRKMAEIFEIDKEYLTGNDLKTQQAIKEITSDENIYSNNNLLTKNELETITKLKNNLNNLQTKNFKNNNLEKSKEYIFEEIKLEEKILDTILSNKQIRTDIFDIDYQKQTFNLSNATILHNTICSNQQKYLITELIDLNEEQCEKLHHYIYHIKNATEKEKLMYKIIFMNKEETEALEGNIIGIKEQSNEITIIKDKYTKGETK